MMLSHRWYWGRSSSFWSAPGIMVAIQLVVGTLEERQCEMLIQEAGDDFQIGVVVCDGICLHVFGTIQHVEHIFLICNRFVVRRQSHHEINPFGRSWTCRKHQALYLRHPPAYWCAGNFGHLRCFKVEDPVNPTNNVGPGARISRKFYTKTWWFCKGAIGVSKIDL